VYFDKGSARKHNGNSSRQGSQLRAAPEAQARTEPL
jgi:hypothetical protein